MNEDQNRQEIKRKRETDETLRSKEMKKSMGRPRQKEGLFSFRDFDRANIAMSLYHEARKNGQKHSVAVAQTVESIKQRYPMVQISETEVKRILAAWSPRGSHTVLRFECVTLTRQELANRIEGQLAAMSQKNGSKLPAPSEVILPISITTYRMILGPRPNYPRHNRKLPKV